MNDDETLLTTDACTLPTESRPTRLAEFDALFADSVRRGERRGNNSVRLHLSGDGGLEDRVRDLTDREAACCSFFRFEIRRDSLRGEHALTLEVSVDPAHESIAEAFASRAEELCG